MLLHLIFVEQQLADSHISHYLAHVITIMIVITYSYCKCFVLNKIRLRDYRPKQLTTPGNTITYDNALCFLPQILHKHCLQFLLEVKMAPRETENNAYAKFWGDKERALWYAMVFSSA